MPEEQKLEEVPMDEETWTTLRLALLERQNLELQINTVNQQIQAQKEKLAMLQQQGQMIFQGFQKKQTIYQQELEKAQKETSHEGWQADTECKVWRRELKEEPPTKEVEREPQPPKDKQKLNGKGETHAKV